MSLPRFAFARLGYYTPKRLRCCHPQSKPVVPDSNTPESKINLHEESPLLIIGWREWVSMPDLGIKRTKAKIDTGARSSSLHAFKIEPFMDDGVQRVRFQVHPIQRRDDVIIKCDAVVHDIRQIRSSSGESSERYVIRTPIAWMGQTWNVDLTLADRSLMGFRMLIGREAIRGRLLVDTGRSYFGPRPTRSMRRPPPTSGSPNPGSKKAK